MSISPVKKHNTFQHAGFQLGQIHF